MIDVVRDQIEHDTDGLACERTNGTSGVMVHGRMSNRRQRALEELAALFVRNGVLRLPDVEQRSKNPSTYKKGYEARFVAYSAQELRHIQRLLRQAGFPVAASHSKSRRFVQPLYGKRHVRRFQQFLASSDA